MSRARGYRLVSGCARGAAERGSPQVFLQAVKAPKGSSLVTPFGRVLSRLEVRPRIGGSVGR